VPAGAIRFARRPPPNLVAEDCDLKGEDAGTSMIGDEGMADCGFLSVGLSMIWVGCVKYGDCETVLISSSSLSSSNISSRLLLPLLVALAIGLSRMRSGDRRGRGEEGKAIVKQAAPTWAGINVSQAEGEANGV